GIICGGGLIVCLVPMLTLLPVLLLRGRQNVIDHKIHEDEKRARIENIWLSRPVLVTAIIVVTCGLAASQLRKVKFDYNLLNMQSAGLPAVVYEQKLIVSADKSVLFGAVVATNLDEAVQLEKQIRTLTNVVADVESIAGFLHQEQNTKLKLISEIKGLVAPLQNTSQDFRKAMLAGDRVALAEHADTLGQFQRALFDDLRGTFGTLQQQDDRAALRIEDLPPALRNRFVGEHGKFLLQVYPKKYVWQRDNQKEFIDTLRAALDPQGN